MMKRNVRFTVSFLLPKSIDRKKEIEVFTGFVVFMLNGWMVLDKFCF